MPSRLPDPIRAFRRPRARPGTPHSRRGAPRLRRGSLGAFCPRGTRLDPGPTSAWMRPSRIFACGLRTRKSDGSTVVASGDAAEFDQRAPSGSRVSGMSVVWLSVGADTVLSVAKRCRIALIGRSARCTDTPTIGTVWCCDRVAGTRGDGARNQSEHQEYGGRPERRHEFGHRQTPLVNGGPLHNDRDKAHHGTVPGGGCQASRMRPCSRQY